MVCKIIELQDFCFRELEMKVLKTEKRAKYFPNRLVETMAGCIFIKLSCYSVLLVKINLI